MSSGAPFPNPVVIKLPHVSTTPKSRYDDCLGLKNCLKGKNKENPCSINEKPDLCQSCGAHSVEKDQSPSLVLFIKIVIM